VQARAVIIEHQKALYLHARHILLQYTYISTKDTKSLLFPQKTYISTIYIYFHKRHTFPRCTYISTKITCFHKRPVFPTKGAADHIRHQKASHFRFCLSSFAKEPCFGMAILKKRPDNSGGILVVDTPHPEYIMVHFDRRVHAHTHIYAHKHTCEHTCQ